MKTPSSTSCFILAAAFLLSSLIWFFWSGNITVGIIWLAVAVAEAAVGLVVWIRQKNNK